MNKTNDRRALILDRLADHILAHGLIASSLPGFDVLPQENNTGASILIKIKRYMVIDLLIVKLKRPGIFPGRFAEKIISINKLHSEDPNWSS